MIKSLPAWMLSGLLLLGACGCIFVRVTGDLDEWDDEDDDEVGFHGLHAAVDGLLVDPRFDLKVTDTPWRTEARWTVAFVAEGSEPEAAFQRAQEAVRKRVQERGGHIAGETGRDESASSSEAGATWAARHARWSCTFHLDGEPGEATVELGDRSGDERRTRELVLTWVEDD